MQQQQIMSNLNQQMQNSNNQTQSNNNNLNIMFKVRGRDENENQINVQIQADEKVSTLIEKYRNKAGDYEKKKKFIFNAKALNPNLTCGEAGLYDNSIVQVLNTRDVEGA